MKTPVGKWFKYSALLYTSSVSRRQSVGHWTDIKRVEDIICRTLSGYKKSFRYNMLDTERILKSLKYKMSDTKCNKKSLKQDVGH